MQEKFSLQGSMEGKFNVGASDRLEGVGITMKSPESQTGYLSKTSQSPGAMHELKSRREKGALRSQSKPGEGMQRENSSV
jgi:hypothetical protein